ncbi:MAG: TlpA family protein disulfide reductase [Acidobacteria bacterium]|nr:TlpA family protein disulfide reductase [Acidobacteriota bacterium]
MLRISILTLAFFCALDVFASGALSGRRAPGFSLPDRTIRQHDPADYRGKVLLIEFMQTKCPTCKTISGVLEQVKAKYGDRIQILSVVIQPDTIDNVNKYIAENNITSPILFDCGQMAASYLKITPKNPTVSFPHLFLIDPEGYIRNDLDHDEANRGVISVKTLSAEIEKVLPGASQKKR